MSHSVLQRKWKTESDLSYNSHCFAGNASSATAPIAEWERNNAIIHLRAWPAEVRTASFPNAQRTVSLMKRSTTVVTGGKGPPDRRMKARRCPRSHGQAE